MDRFNFFKNEIIQISSEIVDLFEAAEFATGFSEKNFNGWKKTCENIQKRLPDEIMRVAAVGPIKSGKSTFVNTLFHGDYLKRGAGVVTSIVTRIRRGSMLRATLFFKSWDEVNQEIDQALTFFPLLIKNSGYETFDIRRTSDRKHLAEVLQSLSSDQLITQATRNGNSVILSSYLKGYDRVEGIVSSDGGKRIYEGHPFSEHRNFSGDEVLAVYLKDIQLEISTTTIEENIEIADCQGSDSSNPLHLAMIQDYLLLANMLVYVISSRTGLRQADIRFLSMIRKMGIMDNTMFVVNCDFSEHETLEGMIALVAKIRDEVSILKPDPELFAFSSLFDLFRAQETSGDLSERDRKRFEQWVAEKDLINFSNREKERFEAVFKKKITSERYTLLLRNHLERLGIISTGVLQWTKLNQEIIEGDEQSAGRILKDIHKNQEKMNRIKSMIRNTLDGCVNRLKSELRNDIDAFFENRSGGIVPEITDFIKKYTIHVEQYKEVLETKGFTETLYAIYQEFKHSLDNMMAEKINPAIIGFIKSEERKIVSIFDSVAQPFDGMVVDALAGYEKTLGHYDIKMVQNLEEKTGSPDIESIKRLTGLQIPTAFAVMRYSARVKTEAVLRLGFYKILNAFKKIFKKSIREKEDDVYQAIKDGIRCMKRETEISILFHFKNYRENIKFQYLFKLIETTSSYYFEALLSRFQAYNTDLVELTQLIDEKRIDKERVFKILRDTEAKSFDIYKRIDKINRTLTEISDSV
ncbi:MAG: hypothetical protein C0403_04200 [Desulfobacterium sp.]|nr:hypothetical protein [Desulfobacterium sp.]